MIVRNMLVAIFLFIFLIVYVLFIKEPIEKEQNVENPTTIKKSINEN